MSDTGVLVRQVDFDNAQDTARYLSLLDAYARDPMGGGRPLPAAVLARLPGDLARHPGAYCLLAERGAAAVGLATCFVAYSTFQARRLLNIHDIAVLPEWRGRSVARALLTAVTDLARRLDCCGITLEVREDNARARSVYLSAGFEPARCSLFMHKAL